MHTSILLEPAFALGFAACFLLIACGMLLFMLVGSRLFPIEAEMPRSQSGLATTSRAAQGRLAKEAGRSWKGAR